MPVDRPPRLINETTRVDENAFDLGVLIDAVIIDGTTFVLLRDGDPVAVLTEYRQGDD